MEALWLTQSRIYASMNWVNIGSVNGSLPDGTKPLHELMLTYRQLGPVAFIWGR